VAKGSTIPLEPWCTKHNVQHVRSTVDKLTQTQALLKDGQTIDYTVCLVATGGGYRGGKMFGRGVTDVPVTREERLATLQHDGEALLKETSVLIVGGGLIGTELAGDLAVYASMKNGTSPKITLVHSGPILAHDNLTEAAATMLHRKLSKLGVTIILNEKCVEIDGKMVLSNSGETVQADRIVYTFGLIPINSFLANGDFREALNEQGWVDTDDYFRVKNGGGRLFALGDCCTTLVNSGAKVIEQLPVIGKNLKAALDAAAHQKEVTEKHLKKAITSFHTVINTVGPKDGVFRTSTVSAATNTYHPHSLLVLVSHTHRGTLLPYAMVFAMVEE
jgi:NADH dehydrogenase FAD-containing subunit